MAIAEGARRGVDTAKQLGAIVVGALIGAFTSFLAIAFSSLFLLLLPVVAFVFGWKLPTKAAMTGTAALLMANSIWAAWESHGAVSILAVPFRMIFTGGIVVFGVTFAGTLLKGGTSGPRFVTAGAVLVAFLAWTAFLAFPRWGHTYQVIVKSESPLDQVTLLLPVPGVDEEPYLDLYAEVRYERPADGHALRAMTTEYGQMLELTLRLEANERPEMYIGNVIFADRGLFARRARPFLGPRLKAAVSSAHPITLYGGPSAWEKSRPAGTYTVPIRATYVDPDEIQVEIYARSAQRAFVSYAQDKSRSWTDDVLIRQVRSGEWVTVDVTTREELRLSRLFD